LLPDAVKSRIAAGEVIERPASVVKELVENALDAGARSIHIEIEAGGRDLIRVTDDGSGMTAEELALSVRRHATSKLETADELHSLESMGFRGEALPSIGSVSRMTITTRMKGADEAWRLSVEGGRSAAPTPAASGIGTVLEVRDIFYNLPARRKFLKGRGPEAAACSDAMLRLALIRPDVSFSLMQGKQEILHCAACPRDVNEEVDGNGAVPFAIRGISQEAYARRVRDVLGRSASKDLVPLVATRPGPVSDPEPGEPASRPETSSYRLFGLVTPPAHSRPNRSSIYLAVNGRPVKDRIFMTALTEAYRHLLPPKRFPAGVLLLELPGSDVDINVHPTKAEVRFRAPRLVFSMMHHAVRDAFVSPPSAPESSTTAEQTNATGRVWPGEKPVSSSESNVRDGSSAPLRERTRFDLWQGERRQHRSTGLNVETDKLPEAANGRTAHGASTVAESPFQERRSEGPPAPSRAAPAPASDSSQSRRSAAEDIPFRILGQAGGAYIVLEDETGVKIIDQHALHERTLFEDLMAKAKSGSTVPSQRLLLPESLELTPAQAAAYNDETTRDILAGLGYDTSEFGPRAIAVNAVPHMLRSTRAAELLTEVLDAVAAVSVDHPAGKKTPDRATLLEKAAYVLSCKGAIKAGERLNCQQMAALLNEYFRIVGARGFTCPHGRPLAIELNWDEIERRVGRG
jgi:DNA mismatch repair protein MutL